MTYLRKLTGLTQAEMAKIAGISVYSVRMLEHGAVPKNLTVELYLNIDRNLGISPKAMMSEDQDLIRFYYSEFLIR